MLIDIDKKTLANKNYRKVLFTTKQQQIVVMSIPEGDDIHLEKHSHTSQFIKIVDGTGYAKIAGKKYKLSEGKSLIVPANTWHQIVNSGKQVLKLYTIYSPPEHPPDTVQRYNPDKEE
jgi:mannose-6-phosphate isomerase-like protein (cupin superfamily)